MDNTEKHALIEEMVERLVLAECDVAAWTTEILHSSTKCERESALEMLNRSTISKNLLWEDFDKTMKELLP